MSYFDDNEDRIIYGRRRGASPERELRCKRCDSTDVRWRQQSGKWVLFSLKPGVEHVCAAPPEDFPEVDDA